MTSLADVRGFVQTAVHTAVHTAVPRRSTAELSPQPVDVGHEGGRVTPARARGLVREVLRGAPSEGGPVPAEAVHELAVVVSELVTNAWQAGSGRVDVWCWRRDGETGVQVDDDGPGLRDPFAGYRRPTPAAAGGRGLWIVRQLADLVEVAYDGRGTSVRARRFDALRASARAGYSLSTRASTFRFRSWRTD